MDDNIPGSIESDRVFSGCKITGVCGIGGTVVYIDDGGIARISIELLAFI